MIPYRLDYAIEKITKSGPSMERTLLRIYTGDDISEDEARNLWKRITDHKWHLSERLSRDVGFHVAAIDYVENFYELRVSNPSEGTLAVIWKKISLKILLAAQSYFKAKGTTAA